MIFYFAPRTVAVASHITLEEVGADYETRVLDFSTGEQRSDTYLGIMLLSVICLIQIRWQPR